MPRANRNLWLKPLLWGLFLMILCGLGIEIHLGSDAAPMKGYDVVTLADLGAFPVADPNAPLNFAENVKVWPSPTPTHFPDSIRALDGKEVVVPGYMMPYDLDANGAVLSFYLVRSIMICCFGQPPRLNEVVRCETLPGHPLQFFNNIPLRVYGKLAVGEIREYGQVQALYRLKVEHIEELKQPDSSLQPVTQSAPSPVPAT